MIRPVCLNPLIDRSYNIGGFLPGKKYKDNLSHDCIGGKGLNIAKVCSQLGEKTTVYGFTGGDTGLRIEKGMAEYDCDLRFVRINEENRTTINIIDREQNLETEIIERGPRVDTDQVDQLLEYLGNDLCSGDIIVCSGISIMGAPDDIYVRISELCHRSGAKCLLDTNGDIFRKSLKGKFFLGKPNHLELAELLDLPPENDPLKIYEMARPLIQQETFGSLLVSTGRDGGILCGRDACYKADVPDVKIISTIGSGDSTLAGYAVGLSREWSVEESLRLSMACGTSNAMSLDIAKIDMSQLTALGESVKVKKIV